MPVPEQRCILAEITRTMADMGGNIISLGTFLGEDPTNRLITVKVADVPEDKLVAINEGPGAGDRGHADLCRLTTK